MDRSFIELGGSSLAANRLAALLARDCGVRVHATTIVGAARLDELVALALSAPPRDAVTRHQTSGTDSAAGPLTPAQTSLVLAGLWERDPRLYCDSVRIDLVEPLEEAAVRRAAVSALRAHPALQGRVEGSAAAKEATFREAAAAPEVAVASDLDDAGLRELLGARPLDLSSGPLARILLLGEAGRIRALVVEVHHVACDGEGLRIFLEDLRCRLRGEPPEGEAAPRYAAYLRATAGRGPDRTAARHLGQGLEPGLHEMAGLDRLGRGAQGRIARRPLDGPLLARLRETASRFSTSPFTICCAAFADALAAIHGLRHPVLCVGVNDRDSASGHARTVGHYVNLLPVPAAAPVTASAVTMTAFARELAGRLRHRHVHVTEVMEALPRSRASASPVRFVITTESGPGDLERDPFARVRWLGGGLAKVPVLLTVIEEGRGADLAVTSRASELPDGRDERLLALVVEGLRSACRLR